MCFKNIYRVLCCFIVSSVTSCSPHDPSPYADDESTRHMLLSRLERIKTVARLEVAVKQRPACETDYKQFLSSIFPYNMLAVENRDDDDIDDDLQRALVYSSVDKDSGMVIKFAISGIYMTEKPCQHGENDYSDHDIELYWPDLKPGKRKMGQAALAAQFKAEAESKGEPLTQEALRIKALRQYSADRIILEVNRSRLFAQLPFDRMVRVSKTILVNRDYYGLYEYEQYWSYNPSVARKFIYTPVEQVADPLYIICNNWQTQGYTQEEKKPGQICHLHTQITPRINYKFQLFQRDVKHYAKMNRKIRAFVKSFIVNLEEVEGLDDQPRRFVDEQGRILENAIKVDHLTEMDFLQH